jgi:hypothetical protein
MHLVKFPVGKCVLFSVALLLLGWWPASVSAEVFAKGALSTSSSLGNVRPGCYCVKHSVKLTAGTTYTIDLRSTDFDSYLVLIGNTGTILAEDDDSSGGLDARITINAPYTGNYDIWVTTFGKGQQGNYTLLVRP